LYRESIEREVRASIAKPKKRQTSLVYSVDSARYTAAVTNQGAAIDVQLSGRVLSGTPAPIPLFGEGVIVTDIVCPTEGYAAVLSKGEVVALLPPETPGPFEVSARIFAETIETDTGRKVMVDIPRALQNTLSVSLPEEAQLLDAPGLPDEEGVYRFAARGDLSLTFAAGRGLAAADAEAVEMDGFTRIRVERDRLFLTTYLVPLRPLPPAITVRPPEEANFVGASLRASRIARQEDGGYVLDTSGLDEAPLWIEFAREIPAAADAIELSLPAVVDNRGQTGRFALMEPDDIQVSVTAEGLVDALPVERLGQALAEAATGQQRFRSVPADALLTMTFHRYTPVETPTTVLAHQTLYSVFEENGSVLSTLMLEVPPEVGPRLRLAAVPDARVWSLTVNGMRRQVFSGEDGQWVVPLDGDTVSKVVLSYLREGKRLGLHGRLETTLPETGLAARDVRIGIALPERIDLLNIEGPVGPASGKGWETPGDFDGRTFFFSRAFYNGEGMTVGVAYKEPVDTTQMAKGEKT
jgi:hypothetical protein